MPNLKKFTLLFAAALSLSGASLAQARARPKLLLILVFDQFRADYLTRFENSFLPAARPAGDVGGFKYLMDRGAYFPYGQYDILQSMTGPGHATILTGAYPYQNGIVTNYWFDQKSQQITYCSEDDSAPLVSESPLTPSKYPVATKTTGVSPKNMNSTTVGDELKNAGFDSKVVTVSFKDRAAILMGGHRADLALWFDSDSHQWISSEYYLHNKKIPAWMSELNKTSKVSEGKPIQWLTPDQVKPSKSGMVWDETLNDKALTQKSSTGDYQSYAMSYGVDLTEAAAEKAFDAFKMGRNLSTDLFAVSFSSHDYAGHEFGPNSREMEKMTMAEDASVSKFLNFVRKRVPLKDVTIVLTGDHGIPPNPDWLSAHGVDAGRIDEKALVGLMDSALDEKFGKPSKTSWFGYFHDFNFYLNAAALADRKISIAQAEGAAKSFLENQKGVAYVFTSTDYAERKLPPGMHQRQILKTYYPGRSGNLIIIPKPFYMKVSDTVDHMTGYNYDRTVPVILAGFGIKAGVYASPAEVIDIAPTLTFLSGVVPPSLSEGRVLSEALAH